MRRNTLLPAFAVAAGVAGAAIRLRQWTAGYDPVTQIFSGDTVVLLPLFLLAVCAIMALFLHGGTTPKDIMDTCRCPATLYITLKTASAFLFLATAALQLLRFWQAYREMALLPPGQQNMASLPWLLVLCAFFCVLSFPGILVVGRAFYRGRLPKICAWLSIMPGFAGLLWVLCIHTEHAADPIFTGFAYTLVTACLMTLASYYLAAGFQAIYRPRRAAFCALAGITVGITSMVSQQSFYHNVLTLAYLLTALADSYAILRSVFGPPWPRRLLEGTSAKGHDAPAAPGAADPSPETASGGKSAKKGA